MLADILCRLKDLYILMLLVRIVLSWFPISPGGAMATVFSFLYAVTEPVLGPVRRMIPPIGMGIDLSPIIVLFGLQILARVLFGC